MSHIYSGKGRRAEHITNWDSFLQIEGDRDDLDKIIEQYHRALDEFVRGRADFVLDLFFERDDVSFANPLGSTVRCRKKIVEKGERAAFFYERDSHSF